MPLHLRYLAAIAFGEGGCALCPLAAILSAIASGVGGSLGDGGCAFNFGSYA